MSVIRPFSAIRYAAAASENDISTRLAPPYDVLSEADKRALLRADERNFVKVDLPHTPPKDAGPQAVYDESRRQLDAWLADRTMIRDEHPAIYVYHQAYSLAGTDFVRKMFFARLRIEPFGTGGIFPHEHTFGGPKEDRLALTKAHQANLSPIFGLYEDLDNAVAERLGKSLSAAPLAVGTMSDVENRLWAVTDAGAIDAVTRMMADKPVFIADGHHRYGTAGLYRDWLIDQEGPLPDEHPANFVLCVFCAMEDPGLLILPTHRVLPGVQIDRGLLKGNEQLEVAHLLAESADEVPDALERFGPQAIGIYDSSQKGYLMARPRDRHILDPLEPDHSPAWRGLALAFLHAYLIDRVVTQEICGGRTPEIRYIKSSQAAIDEANATNGLAFLMQATTMGELRSVCQAGDLMPHKSTYFYPKLASGLVVNPLTA